MSDVDRMGRGSLVTPIGHAVPLTPPTVPVASPVASIGVGSASSIVQMNVGDARMGVTNVPNDRVGEQTLVQRFDMSPETSTIPPHVAESSGSGSWIVPSQNTYRDH